MGRRGVGLWTAVLVLLSAVVAATADDTFYVTAREWQRWDPGQKAFFLKGFVEGFHSAGSTFAGNPDIQTIGDLRGRVDAFYDRFPEASGVEVEAVITTLLTSAMDLDDLGRVLTRRGAVKEESVPPATSSPPKTQPAHGPTYP